ncbi:hypothetical protein DYB38_012618 [Aphanomyces astaci]|uniref:PGAP2IP C-terminal nuclease-like domain-containing protein n=1 Tax=Aphanomyces astaci TaxID=112090 RepID=A0A397CZU0_APHAT|nr:hypothetical protein DYB38_012618 [Aphanomyces astaci]
MAGEDMSSELPWNRLVGMLAAHTATGVVFWALIDQLPRDVYWFCLQEMNLSSKLAFLGLLFLLPLILVNHKLRLAAAQYGSVLDAMGLLCLFVRFHIDTTFHLVALSSDGSVTAATLSVTGLMLANFVTLALRWGNKSLNPVVPGLADALVTVVVCQLPVALACVYLFFYRPHPLLDSPVSARHAWWRSVGSIASIPLVVFVTQWVLPRFVMLIVWTTGLLCFCSTAKMDVQLVGSACMAVALPSLWIDLVPPIGYAPLASNVSATQLVSATVMSGSVLPNDKSTPSPHTGRVHSADSLPTYASPSSASLSTGLCITTCLGTLAYILLTALTIILTCYDYLPDELRFLRGQRYPLLLAVGLLLSAANAVTLIRSRHRRHCRFVRWTSMHALRAVVVTGLLVGVLCPVAIVRLGFNRAGLTNFQPILTAIQDYQPHMVALQSDTMQAGSGAIDMTDFLAQELGMYSYAHPRTDEDSFGCTFLSVFPIVEALSTGVILPSPRGENACMQMVAVDVHGTVVTVVNVHLGNDGMSEKQTQLDVAARTIVSRPMNGPLLVVGDFNTRKNTAQYRSFVQNAGHVRDAGSAANCRQSFNDTSVPIEYMFYSNVTCVQFDYPHTYPQDETADSFPRIGHFTLT